MAFRRELGLVPGNQVRRAIYSHNGPVAKKPCRDVLSSTFVPVHGLGFPSAEETLPAPVIKLDPLYLFYCGIQWHRSARTESGWELVQAMLSEDRAAHALLPQNFWPRPKTDACWFAIFAGPVAIAPVWTHHRKTYPA